MTTLPTPDSLLPTPSLPLPPTTRDFEIHRLALVEFLSTRRIAEKYAISQTRVRQIIARVSEWLTDTLPITTEAHQEKEKRFAIHLAAAQLQNQIEHLQNYWDGSGDPKYLRQQTRSILALARLGVAPGALDALAADANPSPDDLTTDSPSVSPSLNPSVLPSPPLSPSPTPSTSDLRPLTSDFFPSPPPSEDCSPQIAPSPPTSPSPEPSSAPTTSPPTDLRAYPTPHEDTISGFSIMENRLLTLIDQTYPEQTDRLQHLQESLATIRQSRANYILQLSPHSAVVPPTTTPSQLPFPTPLAST